MASRRTKAPPASTPARSSSRNTHKTFTNTPHADNNTSLLDLEGGLDTKAEREALGQHTGYNVPSFEQGELLLRMTPTPTQTHPHTPAPKHSPNKTSTPAPRHTPTGASTADPIMIDSQEDLFKTPTSTTPLAVHGTGRKPLLTTPPTLRPKSQEQARAPKLLIKNHDSYYEHYDSEFLKSWTGSTVGEGDLEVHHLDAFSKKYGLIPPGYVASLTREGNAMPEKINRDHVQIHHVPGHYVVSQLIARTKRLVVWDTIRNLDRVDAMIEQIEALYDDKSYDVVQYRLVQQQKGDHDCGPLAAATVLSILMEGTSPSNVIFKQDTVRQTFRDHLDTPYHIPFTRRVVHDKKDLLKIGHLKSFKIEKSVSETEFPPLPTSPPTSPIITKQPFPAQRSTLTERSPIGIPVDSYARAIHTPSPSAAPPAPVRNNIGMSRQRIGHRQRKPKENPTLQYSDQADSSGTSNRATPQKNTQPKTNTHTHPPHPTAESPSQQTKQGDDKNGEQTSHAKEDAKHTPIHTPNTEPHTPPSVRKTLNMNITDSPKTTETPTTHNSAKNSSTNDTPTVAMDDTSTTQNKAQNTPPTTPKTVTPKKNRNTPTPQTEQLQDIIDMIDEGNNHTSITPTTYTATQIVEGITIPPPGHTQPVLTSVTNTTTGETLSPPRYAHNATVDEHIHADTEQQASSLPPKSGPIDNPPTISDEEIYTTPLPTYEEAISDKADELIRTYYRPDLMDTHTTTHTPTPENTHTHTPTPSPENTHTHAPTPPPKDTHTPAQTPEEPHTQEREPKSQTQSHTQAHHTTHTGREQAPQQTPKYPVYATVLNPDWRTHVDMYMAIEGHLKKQIEIVNGRAAGGFNIFIRPKTITANQFLSDSNRRLNGRRITLRVRENVNLNNAFIIRGLPYKYDYHNVYNNIAVTNIVPLSSSVYKVEIIGQIPKSFRLPGTYKYIDTEQYIDRIKRCTKCQKFDHKTTECKNTIACSLCTLTHHWTRCPEPTRGTPQYSCVNCGGNHAASNSKCPTYIQERDKYYALSKKRAAANSNKDKQTPPTKKQTPPPTQQPSQPTQPETPAPPPTPPSPPLAPTPTTAQQKSTTQQAQATQQKPHNTNQPTPKQQPNTNKHNNNGKHYQSKHYRTHITLLPHPTQQRNRQTTQHNNKQAHTTNPYYTNMNTRTPIHRLPYNPIDGRFGTFPAGPGRRHVQTQYKYRDQDKPKHTTHSTTQTKKTTNTTEQKTQSQHNNQNRSRPPDGPWRAHVKQKTEDLHKEKVNTNTATPTPTTTHHKPDEPTPQPEHNTPPAAKDDSSKADTTPTTEQTDKETPTPQQPPPTSKVGTAEPNTSTAKEQADEQAPPTPQTSQPSAASPPPPPPPPKNKTKKQKTPEEIEIIRQRNKRQRAAKKARKMAEKQRNAHTAAQTGVSTGPPNPSMTQQQPQTKPTHTHTHAPHYTTPPTHAPMHMPMTSLLQTPYMPHLAYNPLTSALTNILQQQQQQQQQQAIHTLLNTLIRPPTLNPIAAALQAFPGLPGTFMQNQTLPLY